MKNQEFYATEEDYINPRHSEKRGRLNHQDDGNEDLERKGKQVKRPRRSTASAAVSTTRSVSASASAKDESEMDSDMDIDEEHDSHEYSDLLRPGRPHTPATRDEDPMAPVITEAVHRADQLALWIKNLSGILQDEAREVGYSFSAIRYVLQTIASAMVCSGLISWVYL